MDNSFNRHIAKIFFAFAALFLLTAGKLYWDHILPPPDGTSEFGVMLYHHSLGSAIDSFSLLLCAGTVTLIAGLVSWFSGKDQWQQTNKIFH